MNTPHEPETPLAPGGQERPPAWPPPPLPHAHRRAPTPLEEDRQAFADEFRALDAVTVSSVTDALLKRPAREATRDGAGPRAAPGRGVRQRSSYQ